jgi:carbamoyl-phosphate synthase large subunit
MKKILILGAGLWQMPYLKKSKELGLFVCATDWMNEPEGRKYADIFEPIDVRDAEKSLDFAKKNNVDAVFTSSDVAVPVAAYIAEKMSLPFHSQELALIATNKYLMRNAIKKVGLKTPKYKLCSSSNELYNSLSEFSVPVIIKPIDNCGSRGVFTINNLEELKKLSAKTFANSFSKKILIEELMFGMESSVEVLVNNGKFFILGWCKKTKSNYPYRYDIQLDYFPDYSEEEHAKVQLMVSTLISGLNIMNGILHIEFIWTNEGVKIIEFALRGCGSNVTTHLLPELREFDVPCFLIEKSFDKNQSVNLKGNKFGSLKFIIPREGKIKTIIGMEKIEKLPYLKDFRCEMKNNDIINVIKDGASRPGHFIVIGNNANDIHTKIEEIERTLKISYYD